MVRRVVRPMTRATWDLRRRVWPLVVDASIASPFARPSASVLEYDSRGGRGVIRLSLVSSRPRPVTVASGCVKLRALILVGNVMARTVVRRL